MVPMPPYGPRCLTRLAYVIRPPFIGPPLQLPAELIFCGRPLPGRLVAQQHVACHPGIGETLNRCRYLLAARLAGAKCLLNVLSQLRGSHSREPVPLAPQLEDGSDTLTVRVARLHLPDTLGPLLSGMFFDEPTIESLSTMGLEVSAVGNHEFDRGPHELLRMQNGGCRPSGCVGPQSFRGIVRASRKRIQQFNCRLD
jgi:hypothetical protein